MLNKKIASLTLIFLLSFVTAFVFWIFDAYPSIFTGEFIFALATATAVSVIVTSARLYSSTFNGEGGFSILWRNDNSKPS